MGDVLTVEESNRPTQGGTSWSPQHTPASTGGSLIASVHAELTEYHQANQKFSNMEPDEVLVMISAITARLSYLRTLLLESSSQRANKLRISNLDPLMTNLDLQFRIASRLLSSRQFDFEVTRGAPT